MSNRLKQIESELKKALSQVFLRKLSDPRIEGMISITRVQVSPDLHDAFVYISVLPDKHQKKTLYGLRHAATYIHRLVSDEVAIKTVPHLDFRLDDSLKKQAVVFEALARAREKTRPLPPEETPPPEKTPEKNPQENNENQGESPALTDETQDTKRGERAQENAS